MFNKVKEIFQKLVTKKEAPQIEAPYKIEPEIKPPEPTPPVEEVKAAVVEEPVIPVKPKKPRTNANGNGNLRHLLWLLYQQFGPHQPHAWEQAFDDF